MAKKQTANLPPKLTEVEQDLLSHIQNGYQLETDSLGGNPILRRLKLGCSAHVLYPCVRPAPHELKVQDEARNRQ
jgi:hypothetical protein